MFQNAKNSKKQGDIGMGAAISHYIKQGYTVSIPITDSQEYDLIVDDGLIKRVQVKTTSYIRKGNFTANLSTKGGNRSFNTIKNFDNILYIICSNGDEYSIPTIDLNLKSSIALGIKYQKYKIMGR